MHDKISLIYILSCGRSGSTLLDLLLGAHPEMWTLGEAEMLPWELKRDRLPCGCGASMRECSFWQEVLPSVRLDNRYHVGYFRDIHGWGRLIHRQLVGDLWRGRVDSRWQDAVDEYNEVNVHYFRGVRDVALKHYRSRLRYLVDASKNPYRLFWLSYSRELDIRVIHLVKDPRGFAFSVLKEYPTRTLRRALRAATRWTVENILFERLTQKRFPPDNVFFLRYEDLASQPAAVLARLGEWLGVTFPADITQTFRKVPNHAVCGNPMRWQDTPIFLDQKWRRVLPAPYRWGIWGIAGWLARRYGYTLAGGVKQQ